MCIYERRLTPTKSSSITRVVICFPNVGGCAHFYKLEAHRPMGLKTFTHENPWRLINEQRTRKSRDQIRSERRQFYFKRMCKYRPYPVFDGCLTESTHLREYLMQCVKIGRDSIDVVCHPVGTDHAPSGNCNGDVDMCSPCFLWCVVGHVTQIRVGHLVQRYHIS